MVRADADFDRQMLEAALEWWRDAGVDTLVEETPCDWFAKPAISSPAAAAKPEIGGAMPEEWGAFLAWRVGEHAPEARWIGPAVPASGPADATFMFLSDAPDRDGELLGGEPGRLFERMLAAIGMERASVHLASVAAKRPTGGRLSREDQKRLGEVALHHLGLVGPKRLLLMGDAASRAVLGMDVRQARGRSHPVNHKSGTTEVVASFHPRLLLDRPAWKREAWADLRLLIRGMGE